MEVYERWLKGIIYVSDMISKPVRTVSESSLVLDAVKIMATHMIGCVVVMRDEGPVGILTKGDILRRGIAGGLDLKTAKVRELMSAPLVTIESNATIEAAAKLMAKQSIKRLPVLKEGKLVGIITDTDIVRKEPVLVRLLDEIARSRRRSN